MTDDQSKSRSNKIEVVIVSGRAGSGKTSVAYEVCEQLRQRNVSHANIDADFLDDIWPEEEGSDLFLRNLSVIWSNYRQLRGCSRLILSGTAVITETELIREAIKQASEAASSGSEEEEEEEKEEEEEEEETHVKITGIILTAPDEVAAVRLGQREIGSALDRHIASSNKWARLFEDFPGLAHRVPTAGRTVRDIATSVLQHANFV